LRLLLQRAGTVALIALLLSGTHTVATAADADFGGPPSGEVPILFNDHTVYATPDILTQERVLAALVKDGQIYVPLRSMFEQMGAVVSVSGNGKTITAVKADVSVSVTLGKAEVVLNGETRRLDVPPMLYHGVLLVPVRVLSEALGAYVQWIPDRHVVAIRYRAPEIPTAPPATPAPLPTAVPTMAPPIATVAPTMPPPPPPPLPPPTAVPTEPSYVAFAQAAYSTSTNYNELVAGGYCDTVLLSAAFAPNNSAFALKANFRQDVYVTSSNATDAFGNHYTQFATIDGGTAFTPVFLARQTALDVRAEFKVAAPRIYVGVGYLHTANNYGEPNLNGFGIGVEKLPDLHRGISVYGSAFYYPSAAGSYTVSNPASANFGATYRQQYQVAKYDIGIALVIAHSPLYLDAGFAGDRYMAKQNAPAGQVHVGPYAGLGVKI
jgi:hypothetical protein